MSHAKVQTDLTAKDDKLQASLKRGESGIGKFAKFAKVALNKLAKSFMVVGAAATGAAAIFVKMATEQLDAEAKLEAVLKATGHAAGYSAGELKKMASELQAITKYGDETTLSAQAILLTFKDIKGDEFRKATELAMDMSTVLGTDLKGSVMQLGKALNDPAKGLSMLSRAGVTFTDQQKDQVKAMQKVGDVAGAQRVMLAELASEFGGAASAAAKTFSGRLAQMKNRLGDVAERVGMALIPVLEKLEPLVKGIANFAENMNSKFVAAVLVTAALAGGLAAMTFVAVKVVGAIKTIIAAIHAMTSAQIIAQAFSGPAGWATIAVGASIAAAGVYGLSRMFTSLKDEAKAAIKEAKEVREVSSSDFSMPSQDVEGKSSAKTVALKNELQLLKEIVAETKARVANAQSLGTLDEKQAYLVALKLNTGQELTKEERKLRENSLYVAENKKEIARWNAEILAIEKNLKAEEDKRLKFGRDMLANLELQLEEAGKTEQQVVEITVARLIQEKKISEAVGRQIIAKTKALQIAKEEEAGAEKLKRLAEATAKTKAEAAKAAVKNIDDQIKGMEKAAAQAFMSDKRRQIDDLKRQGATKDQLARAKKAIDDLAAKKSVMEEMAGKGAKKKGPAAEGRGFSPAFEGLQSLYKRIATASASKPEDRTATATEQSAKDLKKMRELMENPKKGVKLATMAP